MLPGGSFVKADCFLCVRWIAQERNNMHRVSEVRQGIFDVSHRRTAGFYPGVRIRGTRVTLRLQSPKQTSSNRLSLWCFTHCCKSCSQLHSQVKLLTQLVHAICLCCDRWQCLHSKYDLFCTLAFKRACLCPLNMNKQGKKTENKHPVHHANNKWISLREI